MTASVECLQENKTAFRYERHEAERQFVLDYLKKEYKREYRVGLVHEQFDALMEDGFVAKAKIKQAFGLGDDYRRKFMINDPDLIVNEQEFKYLEACCPSWDSSDRPLTEVITSNKIFLHDSNLRLREYKFTKWAMNNDRVKRFMEAKKLDPNKVISLLMDKLANLKREIIVSANPMDILFSSEHAGYGSCHSLGWDDGHSNGNNAYIRDDFTFIIFTTNADKRGASPFPYKHGRSLSYVSPEHKQIILGRLYGNINDAALNQLAPMLAEVFATQLGIDNVWDFHMNGWACNERQVKVNGVRYRDMRDQRPMYFDFCTRGFINHKTNAANQPHFELDFKLARCLTCGMTELSRSSGWLCDACIHATTCGGCRQREGRQYLQHFKRPDTDSTVAYCENCYEKSTAVCPCCEKRHAKDYTRRAPNGRICIDCFNAAYFNCGSCMTARELTMKATSAGGRECCTVCVEQVNERERVREERRRREAEEIARLLNGINGDVVNVPTYTEGSDAVTFHIILDADGNIVQTVGA